MGSSRPGGIGYCSGLPASIVRMHRSLSPVYLDNAAVTAFAQAMTAKMEKKRAAGMQGWHDDKAVSVEDLARMFVEHLPKGDMVDIGNFAMMLFHREGGAQALADLIKGNMK